MTSSLCVKLKPFPFHQAVTQSEDTIVQETLRVCQESPAQTLKTVLSNVLEIPRKAALLGHSGKTVQTQSFQNYSTFEKSSQNF